MTSYTERLARLEATYTPPQYVTNEEYRKQKAALTRAINSGNGRRVLAAVEKATDEWRGKAWPDDWSRWRRALEDASQTERRHARANYDAGNHDEAERLEALSHELRAASVVLFP